MSDVNTPVQDLTEMERLIIGSAVNFLYNIFDKRILDIENNDPELLQKVTENQQLQQDFILLRSFRDVAESTAEMFGATFSEDEREVLLEVALKLDLYLHSIFNIINSDNEEEE